MTFNPDQARANFEHGVHGGCERPFLIAEECFQQRQHVIRGGAQCSSTGQCGEVPVGGWREGRVVTRSHALLHGGGKRNTRVRHAERSRDAGSNQALILHSGAIREEVAEPLGLAVELAALGVSEIVDENMANAARVHAIESGKDARGRTLVAFGGAAPLHAARMAEKLGLDRVLVPSYAGVGSAVGFLRAPIAYEIVRSSLQRLDEFDAAAANALFAAMRAEAEPIVRRGAGDQPLTETRSAFMRYRGQGHEIAVPLPARNYRDEDATVLHDAFEEAYRRLYSRVIPGVEVEILSWVLLLSGPAPTETETAAPAAETYSPEPAGLRAVFDPDTGEFIEVAIHDRRDLRPGASISGPAVITEDETSTVVSRLFDARLDAFGYIELTRR